MTIFEELFRDYEVVDSLGRRRRYMAPFWRFWKRLDRSLGPDGCWPFLGSRNPHGYGQLSYQRGRLVLAHRLAMMVETLEPIPDGLEVLHSCDNPPCCNTLHLRLGTHQDNVNDMVTRGRTVPMRNERCGKAKLTNAEVAEIRDRCAGGETQKSAAHSFGVHPAHVSRIVNLKRRPIDAPPPAGVA